MDVIPLIMRSIRSEMRGHRAPELSVPQYRALAFAGIHQGTTLNNLANHLGLMPPAASKIVEGLVSSGLLERQANQEDRRRLSLGLTVQGELKLETAKKIASESLAEIFASVSKADCEKISATLQQLRTLFLNPPKKQVTHRNESF